MLSKGLKAALQSRKAAVDACASTSEATGDGSRFSASATSFTPARSHGFAGLSNLGATCYMNSLLQALFCQANVRRAVLQFAFDEHVQGEEKRCVLRQLQWLFSRLLLSQSAAISTLPLTKSFGWDSSEAFVQNDVHECLNVLLEAIAREDATVGGVLRDNQLGLLEHYIQCEGCGTVRTRPEEFTTFMIPVKGCADVDAALHAALSEEVLSGDNAYSCETCGSKQTARKGVRLPAAYLPPTLFLHLNRFEFDFSTMMRRKIQDPIVPALLLDMSAHAVPAAEPTDDASSTSPDSLVYELCGMLMHVGSAMSGHYFAYLRVPAEGGSGEAGSAVSGGGTRWLSFNDSIVTELKPDQLARALGQRSAAGSSSAPASNGPSSLPSSFSAGTVSDGSSGAYLLIYRRRDKLSSWFEDVTASSVPADIRSLIEAENERILEAAAKWEAEKRKLRFRVYPIGELAASAASTLSSAPSSLSPAAPRPVGAAPAISGPRPTMGPRPGGPLAVSIGSARPSLPQPPRPSGPPTPPRPPSRPSATAGGRGSVAPSVEVVVDKEGDASALLRAAVIAATGATDIAESELALYCLRQYDVSQGVPLQPVITGCSDDCTSPLLGLPPLFSSPPPSTDTDALSRPRALCLEKRASADVAWEAWEGLPVPVRVVLVTRNGQQQVNPVAKSIGTRPLDGFSFSAPLLLQLRPSEATVGGLRRAVAASQAPAVDVTRLLLAVLPTSSDKSGLVLSDDSASLLPPSSASGSAASTATSVLADGAIVHAESGGGSDGSSSALLHAWEASLHCVNVTCIPSSASSTSDSDHQLAPLQVVIDDRQPVTSLREMISEAYGLSPRSFKLCRQPPSIVPGDSSGCSSSTVPVGELKDVSQSIASTGLLDGCDVYLLPGLAPMEPGFVAIRVSVAPATTQSHDKPALQPLGVIEVPSSALISDIKQQLYRQFFETFLQNGVSSPQHLRVREAPSASGSNSASASTITSEGDKPAAAAIASLRLGKLYAASCTLESAVGGKGRLRDGMEVVLQPLAQPELTSEGDGLVSIYHWQPATGQLTGPSEVLLRHSTSGAIAAQEQLSGAKLLVAESPNGAAAADFWSLACAAAGIAGPLDRDDVGGSDVLVSKPWAWQLSDIANLWRLKWTPLHTLLDVPSAAGITSAPQSPRSLVTSSGLHQHQSGGSDASTVTGPAALTLPSDSCASSSGASIATGGVNVGLSAGTTPAPSPVTIATTALLPRSDSFASLDTASLSDAGGDGSRLAPQLSMDGIGSSSASGPPTTILASGERTQAQQQQPGTPSSSAAAAAAAAARVITSRLRSVTAAAAAGSVASKPSPPFTLKPGDTVVLVSAAEYSRLDAPGRPSCLGGSATHHSGGPSSSSSSGRTEEAFKIYTPEEQRAREAARAAAAEKTAAEVAERRAQLQAAFKVKLPGSVLSGVTALTASDDATGAGPAPSKYLRMLQLGMSPQQVRARMSLDGLDPNLLPLQ